MQLEQDTVKYIWNEVVNDSTLAYKLSPWEIKNPINRVTAKSRLSELYGQNMPQQRLAVLYLVL